MVLLGYLELQEYAERRRQSRSENAEKGEVDFGYVPCSGTYPLLASH